MSLKVSYFFLGPSPNITACTFTIRLNSTTGAYLKTICIITQSLSCTAASNVCTTNGMNLFAVNTADVYDSMMAATSDLLENKYSGSISLRFWINGKKTLSGWKTYTPNEAPLYPNGTWYLDDPDAGDHLSVYMATLWSPTVFSGDLCIYSHHVYCEL